MAGDIPFFALDAVPADVRGSWQQAIARAIDSGVLIGGPEVQSFEAEFARYCEVEHCVGVGNGLDALALSLRGLEIGKGCRVAVPGHTFIATWLAVLAVGAEPVGIDVDAHGLIDLDELESAGHVDAVIPVHLHGQLVDMPRLAAWARARDVVVIEDCAQAHGAAADGWRPGQLSDAAAFSFYPTKNLGGLGDGGGILTGSESLSHRLRMLRNYGATESDKHLHPTYGTNSRLDAVQAAALRENLRHLDDWNARRREIASRYLEALDVRTDGPRPLVSSPAASVWHHFVVLTERREDLRAALKQRGIRTEVHYPNMAGAEIAAITGSSQPSMERSARIADTCVSIPLHQWLDDAAVDRVCQALAEVAG